MRLNIIKITVAFFIILLSSCTVNDKTGLITVYNHTDQYISLTHNGKSVAWLLGNGQKYDYWFFENIGGRAESSDVETIYVAENYNETTGMIQYSKSTKCYFKPGYHYEIRFIKLSAVDILAYIDPGIKVGEDKNDDDFYHYPAAFY